MRGPGLPELDTKSISVEHAVGAGQFPDDEIRDARCLCVECVGLCVALPESGLDASRPTIFMEVRVATLDAARCNPMIQVTVFDPAAVEFRTLVAHYSVRRLSRPAPNTPASVHWPGRDLGMCVAQITSVLGSCYRSLRLRRAKVSAAISPKRLGYVQCDWRATLVHPGNAASSFAARGRRADSMSERPGSAFGARHARTPDAR
jgi:hypothetical protein